MSKDLKKPLWELLNEGEQTQQAEKSKPELKAPKTFDELFYNTELVQPSIDILREIEPPLIDTNYNYIGKLKGIICVWIDELQRQGIVKARYCKTLFRQKNICFTITTAIKAVFY